MAAADLDGDGRPDLAVANHERHTVSVLRNHGDGAFAARGRPTRPAGPTPTRRRPPTSTATAGPTWSRPTTAAAASALLQNRGDGTLRTAAVYGVAGNPIALAVGDFDGDGRPDIATANY